MTHDLDHEIFGTPESFRLITAIRVEKLFGLYTYRLPEEGTLRDATILYGDNGVGKTTILRLVFHLLSAATDRGHRTALYKTQFDNLEVDLASGITLRARPVSQSTRRGHEGAGRRALELSIRRGFEIYARWIYTPNREVEETLDAEYMNLLAEKTLAESQTGRIDITRALEDAVPTGEEIYIEVLKNIAPATFILTANRELISDSLQNPEEANYKSALLLYQRTRERSSESELRGNALARALSDAADWIRTKALEGSNKGFVHVHSVYEDVLAHVLSPFSAPVNVAASLLMQRLERVEQRTKLFAEYELASISSITKFQDALQDQPKEKSDMAVRLLEPYVKSLEARLNAVDPIYEVVHNFVGVINTFFRDKKITFKQSEGFLIRNRIGRKLSPAQLSSGEQQLLLLFSHLIVAHDAPTVFIVDEPELSLNVKWQRSLIATLLRVSTGTNIQFLFASHSIELLAQHRARVVELVNV